MLPFFQGFGVGAGLIVAIGAQNAFVLSQSVRKQYIWLVVLICAICDAILMFSGAAGVGSLVLAYPKVKTVAALGGALFLFCYGLRSLRSALAGGVLKTADGASDTLVRVAASTLAVTLLNPHVYLDTLVLAGSISGQFGEGGRYIFALGASTASLVWFCSLGFGGMMLAPLFRNDRAWRILDLIVCCTMWAICLQLLRMGDV